MKTFEKLVWAEISGNTEGTWDHLQLVFDLVMGGAERTLHLLLFIYFLNTCKTLGVTLDRYLLTFEQL